MNGSCLYLSGCLFSTCLLFGHFAFVHLSFVLPAILRSSQKRPEEKWEQTWYSFWTSTDVIGKENGQCRSSFHPPGFHGEEAIVARGG